MSTSQQERWSETNPLLADPYQFTMLQAYFDRRMFAPAVFELFLRKLPPVRNFLLATGLRASGPLSARLTNGTARDRRAARDLAIRGSRFSGSIDLEQQPLDEAHCTLGAFVRQGFASAPITRRREV